MSEHSSSTIHQHDRVCYRGAPDRKGRVVEITASCRVIVWWAPTLEHLREQSRLPPGVRESPAAQDSCGHGVYHIDELERC